MKMFVKENASFEGLLSYNQSFGHILHRNGMVSVFLFFNQIVIG